MLIRRLMVGALQTNCYIVGSETTSEAAIIDPGGSADAILSEVKQHGLTVTLIINTHAHVDHIAANAEIQDATKAHLAIHDLDAASLTDPMASLSFFVGASSTSPTPDQLLKAGDRIQVGTVSLEVLHTPGHTPGSISLWSEAERVVFTGDALFSMGIGRTDFPGGSHETLIRSIREKLFSLPGDTTVYSGHGPETTIQQEKSSNPWLR